MKPVAEKPAPKPAKNDAPELKEPAKKAKKDSKTPAVPAPVYRTLTPGKPNLKKIVSSVSKLDADVRQALKEFNESTDAPIITFPYQGKEMRGYIFAYKGIDHLIIIGEAGAAAINDYEDEIETMDLGEETPDVGDEDLGGDDEEEDEPADEPYEEDDEGDDED
ncbi:MAG: hypothetical protein JNJ99_15180 [Crocinitomicaceae bacterium]|nr:hypothetical protein [Crocinitomicaceae bacterium]